MVRDYLGIASRIPLYWLSRATGSVPPLPISIALSLTNRCSSRCRTCNIWKVQKERPERIRDELTTEEWGRILRSIGHGPLWFTLTGGEPFLRTDLEGIVSHIARHNRPRYLNIATSAIYPEKTADTVGSILAILPRRTVLTVNVSIDNIGKRYDSLRGVPLGFRNVERSIALLKGLKANYPNLIIGTNIVLSKHNEKRFEQIYAHISDKLQPDSIVCELGAAREAFFFHEDISIPGGRCKELLDFLIRKEGQKETRARIIRRFRRGYYRLIKARLFSRKSVGCYAGYASAEISSTGEVWECSIRADSMGSLREHGYDFRRVWGSGRAREIRKCIRDERCMCTGANPNYTSLLCNLDSLPRLLSDR